MKPHRRKTMLSTALLSLLAPQIAFAAVTLDVTNIDSIKVAAKAVAANMMSQYTGSNPGDIPGNLPAPYYWWEAGAMFGAMIDYWYFTGDDTWNNVTMQAMLHQVGPDNDYMPPNQTKTEGNDDQAFWAMAAMSAAENKFPDPPEGQPQWLALVQAVFNLQVARWDTSTCGGGLRWQIYNFNSGYNYKNTISNGCFFNIASRLAVYTGNQTYADWAIKMWDWTSGIGLFDQNYNFFDGSDDNLNCTQMDHIQWTYNAGTWLYGASNMYNFTNGDPLWQSRLQGIIGNLPYFLKGDQVMSEVACEVAPGAGSSTCNVDQRSFKAYLARWMAGAAVKAPFTYPSLKPILEKSAQAAAATCTGGSDGNSCGMYWVNNAFDGNVGVGEQMSALEVIQANLIDTVEGPATAKSGGTSKGNPNAGTGSNVGPADLLTTTVTTADRAGAAIITIAIAFMFIGGAWWMIV